MNANISWTLLGPKGQTLTLTTHAISSSTSPSLLSTTAASFVAPPEHVNAWYVFSLVAGFGPDYRVNFQRDTSSTGDA